MFLLIFPRSQKKQKFKQKFYTCGCNIFICKLFIELGTTIKNSEPKKNLIVLSKEKLFKCIKHINMNMINIQNYTTYYLLESLHHNLYLQV